MFKGRRCSTWRSSTFHRCSIGFKSGEVLCHWSTFTFLVFRNADITLAECLGLLSCWKMAPQPRCLRDVIIFFFNILQYMSAFIIPSMKWISPTPLALTQPQTMRLPPPCLTVGTRQLSLYSSLGRRHAYQTPSEPKRFILVLSDHKTESQKDMGLSLWSFANCKRPCLCLGLRKGFLHGRRPCRFPSCGVRRIVAAKTLLPVVSDTALASCAALCLRFWLTNLST